METYKKELIMVKIGDMVQFGDKKGLVFSRNILKRALLVAAPQAGEDVIIDYELVPVKAAQVVMTRNEMNQQNYPWWRCNGSGEYDALPVDRWEYPGEILQQDEPLEGCTL